MFCTQQSHNQENTILITKTQISSQIDSKSQIVQFSLQKSRYSWTSTIDSPIISSKKLPFQDEGQEIEETCSDFQIKGYCVMGQQCKFFHETRKQKNKRMVLLKTYPQLLLEVKPERRKYALF